MLEEAVSMARRWWVEDDARLWNVVGRAYRLGVPVQRLCEILEVSRATLYRRIDREL